MPPFQYPPLLPLELRLLVLQPGLPEDPLTGTLLASALRALRYRHCKRLLWCDSICINQKDVAERSAQVQRMADLYQFARRVIVWLGPAAPWSTTAMETMRWVRNQLSSPAIDISSYEGPAPNFAPTKDRSRQEIDCKGPLPLAQDQWLAFEQLLAVDWFRRLWTYQEIVLANQETSIVRLGDEEMLWNKFIEAAMFICFNKWSASQPFFVDLARHTRNIKVFCNKAVSSRTTQQLGRDNTDWVFLLSATKLYDCSDSRDKLYALRGFLEPDSARSIPVDYTKSAKQIVASASVTHLKQRRNLQFLELCNSTISPSWAVDLQKPLGLLQLFSNTGARSAASARLIKSGVLEVAGVSCDEICDSIMDLPPRENYELLEDYITNVLKVFRNLTGNDDFHRDDKCLDELIDMMTFGHLWDYSTLRTECNPSWKTISLGIGRQMIRQWMTGNAISDDYFNIPYSSRSVVATACTRTRHGALACVPLDSCDGDIIVTLLGMSSNLVLRLQPEDGSYKVVGPCYHPGFSDGQALLGDDFRGWEKLWCIDTQTLAFWKEGEPLSFSDPRLDGVPLPVGYTERAVAIGEKYVPFWVHKYQYEDYMENERIYDPRMSEHRLTERRADTEISVDITNLENVEGTHFRGTALMACSESLMLFLLVILLMIINKDMETDGKLRRREMPSRVIHVRKRHLTIG
ncbi:heterokaryon incompatibility protein-domain-containing protein [Fusarium sp. MPI-SDFR-AT-0072]|nr:heterokaryon incompatibility protein-domain-containing protein [Fusarium sp. MPI-SDFR-AT-0072]